jgi:hypothetical protein
MTKNIDSLEQPQPLAPGDIVAWSDKPGYGWMTIEAIDGNQALCSHHVSNTPLDGERRPTALVRQEGTFPISELRLIRGH